MTKLILIILATLLSGCASVVSTVSYGHPNRKEILVPPGSKVTMRAMPVGSYYLANGNGRVTIARGDGPFRSNVGRVEKDGNMIAVVQRRVNWWIAGNYIYGYFPGLFVDLIGGGAYNPTVVHVKTDAQVLKEIESSTKPKS